MAALGAMGSPSKTYQVLVVDDQSSICQALRRLFGDQGTFQLCGEAHNGYEALQRALELKPEIIVMDVSMPGLDGLEAARRIHKILPDIEVLIFTQHESLQVVQAAKEAGARGCLSKSDAAQHLFPALRSLCLHQPFFPDSSTSKASPAPD